MPHLTYRLFCCIMLLIPALCNATDTIATDTITNRLSTIPDSLVSVQPTQVEQTVATVDCGQADSVIIIRNTEITPDDIYGDTTVDIADKNSCGLSAEEQHLLNIKTVEDREKIHWAEFAVPVGVATVASLFVKTPELVKWREEVQKHLSNHGKDKTSIDNYIQYSQMVASYALYFCGVKGEHNLLDKTILLAMSYATFAILNNSMKFAFKEKRPDSDARNSFPSGHTGTAFMGAEYLRREYWSTSPWIGIAGYAVAAVTGYLRIYNDRHWINDVIGGAAIGYLSTTFAYWLYPKIFRKRATMHRQQLLEELDEATGVIKKEKQISWMATPYAGSGQYGVAVALTF